MVTKACQFQFVIPVRMVFENIHEPQWYSNKTKRFEATPIDGVKPQWAAGFQFEPDSGDLAEIKKLTKALMASEFPSREAKTLQRPWKTVEDFLTGMDEKKTASYLEYLVPGNVILSTHTYTEPALSARMDGRSVDYRGDARPLAKKTVFRGGYCLAEINLAPHSVGSNTPGVTAYLNHVYAVGKGDPIQGGRSTEDKFSGYLGHVTAADPTASDEF